MDKGKSVSMNDGVISVLGSMAIYSMLMQADANLNSLDLYVYH